MSSCRATARVVAPTSVATLAPLPSVRHTSVEAAAYEAGVRAGLEQALAGPAAELERAREDLESAGAALNAGAGDLRRSRERAVTVEGADLAALALQLVESIVGQMPDALSPALVESALSLVPDDSTAVLRLHPDDSAAIGDMPLDAKVVPDPGVERGGCVVEVGPTRIDAQRGPALSRLARVLAEA